MHRATILSRRLLAVIHNSLFKRVGKSGRRGGIVIQILRSSIVTVCEGSGPRLVLSSSQCRRLFIVHQELGTKL